MADPLSASALVAALRREGCRVEEYRAWRTHNRNHKGDWGPINGVMVHHTVTSGTDGSVRLCYEGYSGLPGPLCHGVIAKDGTVYLVGNGRANHAGWGDDNVMAAVVREDPDLPAANERNTDGNSRFYGFECINLGDGEDPWPAAQLEAIERATAAICRAYGWRAESVIGHKEWSYTKIDPAGFSMEGMRRRIQARLDRAPDAEEEQVTQKDIDEIVRRVLAGVGSAVLRKDGIVEVQGADEDNPTWQFGNVVELLQKNQNKILDALAALAAGGAARDAALAAIAESGGLTAEQVTAAAETGARTALAEIGALLVDAAPEGSDQL
ncbi:peptidoglycan recognition family protein [Streptomyces sp. DSM 42041]|uniref:Peptidoglycan recognition family protein n=1 Tax=Streptomyces hazeniae TaxID=3075538 RepID=A0ABU2NJP9_9ACTN|nr:peptidoglycan recognition family protein [Streptomyces sp. DSM 42041]MDT0377220.1 peptidoglycan recognition family protein [Streptomyces sp. DSM 42041]